MDSGLLLNDIVSLIVIELKKTPAGASLDVTKYKAQVDVLIGEIKSKVKPGDINTIVTYLKSGSVIGQLVEVCMSNIQSILKDGKIDLDDTSYFLDIIRAIYTQVNAMNDNISGVKITSDNLIDICSFFIKTLMVYTITDQTESAAAVRLTNSAVELIRFSVTKTSWSLKCCCA